MVRNSTSPSQPRRRRRGFGAIRRLPSKRYQASFLSPDGERIVAPTTFEVMMDAEAWLAINSAAITEGRWKKPVAASPADITFQEYAEDWLRRRELKPRTRAEYERLLALLMEGFAAKRIDAITPDVVRRWYESLDPTRPTRRAHQYDLLRTIMGTAVDEEVIDASPCRIRGAGKAKRARQIRPATLADLKVMTGALPEQWRVLLQLASWCALRFGELTELRRMDVDLDNGCFASLVALPGYTASPSSAIQSPRLVSATFPSLRIWCHTWRPISPVSSGPAAMPWSSLPLGDPGT